MSDRGIRWATLAILAAVGAFCVGRLELTHTILHFIPEKADAELLALSIELVESPLAQRMTLSVEGGPRSAEVAARLGERLRKHPEVAWVDTGLDEADLRELYTLYFDRRLYFASDQPATEIPEMLRAPALEERAERLRRQLAQPGSSAIARVAPADPLALFEAIVDRTRAFAGRGLGDEDGQHYATLQLGLRSSPFDSGRQSALLRAIRLEFASVVAAEGGETFRLEQSGVNRYAVATERNVRADVNTISVLSLAAVSTLFLLVFRSFRQLLIAFVVPLGGFGVALAVAAATGEAVHGITLGFGFVLIGVAIDYPVHLMNHHALARDSATPRDTRDRLRNSLLSSGVTTTLAFSSLALSDFPGLAEMGRFAAVGVPVALGLAVLVLPAFLHQQSKASPTQRALSTWFSALVAGLSAHRGVAAVLCLLVCVSAALGIPRLKWEDDPATLMAVDPALHAESERVRRRVAEFDGGRFVVGLSADAESALALNAEISRRLRRVVAAGELDAVGSLHAFLWPEALQRENLETFQATPQLAERIDRAFSTRGFKAGAFQAFADAVETPAAPPLRMEDLAASPLARALDSLVALEGRWAAVTYLRGVRSGPVIAAALEGLEGAHFVDQKEILSSVYGSYRRSATRTVAIGAGIVLLVLVARYRSATRAALAFLPAALATSGVLGVLGIAGVGVNVASVISLLVVLGMGVDYGIFAVDAAWGNVGFGPTLSSLWISCVTSVFVFGVLALSGQPVLRAIGLVTGIGVLLALALAPVVIALARPRVPSLG